MLTGHERVLRSLDFQVTDRVPRDLGGMRSTCISAFSYPSLVEALGLPPRLPRIEDTGQMLALPDLDVLNALNCDVVTVLDGVTNAFPQPDEWHPYDFNGRLPALVRWPEIFQTLADGTILQRGISRMVPSAFVFDEDHGGQVLNLSTELPRLDLDFVLQAANASIIRDEKVAAIRKLCHQVRAATQRAVFFNDGSLQAPISIGAQNGLAIFPMLCLTEPEYVMELHEILTLTALKNIERLLPEIRDDIDILMLAADDWGTQSNLIASSKIYRSLFLPYYRRLTQACHALAPQVKLFLHSCGAIYDLLDLVIESGFDILNPVQWSAGRHSCQAWKDHTRGRISLWGGGVNSQVTLPFGSVTDVKRESAEVVDILKQGGGYVFCNIHNLLAEVAPEKIIALYQV